MSFYRKDFSTKKYIYNMPFWSLHLYNHQQTTTLEVVFSVKAWRRKIIEIECFHDKTSSGLHQFMDAIAKLILWGDTLQTFRDMKWSFFHSILHGNVVNCIVSVFYTFWLCGRVSLQLLQVKELIGMLITPVIFMIPTESLLKEKSTTPMDGRFN